MTLTVSEKESLFKHEGNTMRNFSPKITGIDKEDERTETPININTLTPIQAYDPTLITTGHHSRVGNEAEEMQHIKKSIETIQTDLRMLSTSGLSESVVRNLQLFLLQQDNNQTYISRNEKYNYLRNLEQVLKNMKMLEDARQDEISSIRSTFEEKLNLLEEELQRKDSLIEVLIRVSDEKDKVIESLHLYNGARVVTPRELRDIKQEISNLKRQLPETTETLTTIKKDRKKATSSTTEPLQGKKGVYNLKEKKEQVKEVRELRDGKDVKDLKEYVSNSGRSKSITHSLVARKDTKISHSSPISHSLERLPNIAKRFTK